MHDCTVSTSLVDYDRLADMNAEPPIDASGHLAGRPPIVVLLVDDQAFVGAALGLMLKSEPDIELHSCLWSANAIALANHLEPSIIFQDLEMPGLDGLTLLRMFRDNPQTAGTPVIVLSAHEDPGARASALAEGAADYFVKLPSKKILIACIRGRATQGADGSDTLDIAVLNSFRADGQDFARELIDQFMKEARTDLSALVDASRIGDGGALTEMAHRLKGSCLTMGVSRLAVLCTQVEEQVVSSGGGSITAALLTELELEFTRVQAALTAQRNVTGQP